MAFYKTPLQPYDPVNPDQRPAPPIRYYRENFNNTGQDSYTQAPAQDQSMWDTLTNVMPITDGTLNVRFGAATFNSSNNFGPFVHACQYQNAVTGSRRIIFASANRVIALNESGTNYDTSVAIPTKGIAPRLITSRNYLYMTSGQGDVSSKYIDSSLAARTNWGIAGATGGSTSSTSAGPLFAGTASGPSWTTPGNATGAPDGAFAVDTVNAGLNFGPQLILTNFAFAIPSSATVLGIKVEIDAKCTNVSNDTTYSLLVQLTKDSSSGYGGSEAALLTAGAGLTFLQYGGLFDLWSGASWQPTDVNNATNPTFGIIITPNVGGAVSASNTVFSVDAARITVFYSTTVGAITSTVGGAGTVTLTIGRVYYCVFNNDTTGHFSDLNPASGTSGPCTGKVLNLTTIPVSTDAQVSSKTILATADGGDPAILYFLANITNASTTYTDNIPETTLLNNQIYQYTDQFNNDFGVSDNTPPPGANNFVPVLAKHKGRLWMGIGQNLYFSKSVADLTLPNGFVAGKYEEAWPGDNYFDISSESETLTGILSDGNVLYIGTDQHVRRLFGDDPSNFSQPEIIHPSVGVLNQDVWQLVFSQGTPIGSIWLTPDAKVIFSDGNTYQDIGRGVQDVLTNALVSNPTVFAMAHSDYFADGEFELFVLSVPTNGSSTAPDLHLVFDLRVHTWSQWIPPAASRTFLFNITAAGSPQWLFADNLTNNTFVYRYTRGLTHDKASTIIPMTATTSWLHLGTATFRKLLNEIELVGDTNLKVSVFGANTQADFASPITIVSNSTPVLSPMSTYKVYLASFVTKYKYYQITFSSNTLNVSNLLDSYNIESLPMSDV